MIHTDWALAFVSGERGGTVAPKPYSFRPNVKFSLFLFERPWDTKGEVKTRKQRRLQDKERKKEIKKSDKKSEKDERA